MNSLGDLSDTRRVTPFSQEIQPANKGLPKWVRYAISVICAVGLIVSVLLPITWVVSLGFFIGMLLPFLNPDQPVQVQRRRYLT